MLLDPASLCGVTGRVIPHRDAESRNTRAEISHQGRFLLVPLFRTHGLYVPMFPTSDSQLDPASLCGVTRRPYRERGDTLLHFHLYSLGYVEGNSYLDA